MIITRVDIDNYRRDGVTCIRSLIDEDRVTSMHDAAVALMDTEQHAYQDSIGRKSRLGDTATVMNEPGRFFGGVFMSEESEIFRDFAMNATLARAAAGLMQSDVARFFYDQLFIKDPGTISPTLWHHDMPFWPLAGSHLISCWVALTPATRETSGLEYIAGSQNWDKFYQATYPTVRDATMEPAPDFSDPANRSGHRFLSWDMAPGDVLFHHPLTVHGAGGNRSLNQRRIGLSIRYIGNDARWAPRERAMKLPRDPAVSAGEYPNDDRAFPIAWAAR